MEAEHKGVASNGQQLEPFWDDRRAWVVGKTRCKVARRMAQWASSQDDEQQQGVGDSNTPINQKGPSCNDEIPPPLMDCGQGKNMSDEGDVCVDVTVGVGVDVASGKDGK